MNVLRGVSFDVAAELRQRQFAELAKQQFAVDKYTCKLCGFKSRYFMRLLPFNDNAVLTDSRVYENRTKTKFKTVCCMCFEANRLSYSVTSGLGKIIHLPELSQSAINNFVHSYLNVISESIDGHSRNLKTTINSIKNCVRVEYSLLSTREKAICETLGVTSSHQLTNFLSLMPDSAYKKSPQFLRDARYLPDLSAYEKRAQKWKSEAYKPISLNKWEEVMRETQPEIYEQWLKATAEEGDGLSFPRLTDDEQ
ncbi:hypothetical protein [Alteromonas antoniana]|uniref:hypothetical protein n=1 Tax=Alteromonas antoniana TaxID=2803813 RepID=UPI001C439704|nr:hypothetical protein [Alteromonas antoniana]